MATASATQAGRKSGRRRGGGPEGADSNRRSHVSGLQEPPALRVSGRLYVRLSRLLRGAGVRVVEEVRGDVADGGEGDVAVPAPEGGVAPGVGGEGGAREGVEDLGGGPREKGVVDEEPVVEGRLARLGHAEARLRAHKTPSTP